MNEYETLHLLMALVFFFIKPLIIIHTGFFLHYTDYLYVIYIIYIPIYVGSGKPTVNIQQVLLMYSVIS